MNTNPNPSGSEATQQSVQYDWHNREMTAAGCVTNAIAALTGVPATRLRPLYETIDPDALNSLLEPASDSACSRSPTSVSFHHHGCDVFITAGGRLSVTRRPTEE